MGAPEDSVDGGEERRSNFIRDIIDRDIAADTHGGRVLTRFPPEPNGYLHIGHAKSLSLNFSLARDYAGGCNLRFDDTNPTKEEVEFVESIQADVAWLGLQWAGEVRFASDYFEFMYEYAVQLIKDGKAYVDSLDVETLREYRGSFDEPGRDSPHRDRSVAESLDLFARMRAGEFPDGAHTLRARIDMAHPNMVMRDPLLYRIKHAHHHRTGDDWCIYPMYDYAHCLEDAYEHITHSICTLEFESNRELYDWVLDNGAPPSRPRQYEFARLALEYTLMSKRKLLQLVEEGVVSGWDDPRMPTLSGMRRLGITPESIHRFCDLIGVAKNNSTVDIAKLEYCVRDDLNHRCPRVMCVVDPLKIVLTNYPEGQSEELEASYWPHDVPKEGSRPVPFSREILIEREDFAETPPPKWHRLSPGAEVRLRYAYLIRCEEVVKDPETGEVVELRCTYDPETRGGNAPDGRKVRGTLHWVSAHHGVPVEVRLYDRLFGVPHPGADPEVDFLDQLNPDSLVVAEGARIEPAAASAQSGSRFQFERQGYFIVDTEDSAPGAPVFNRTITLKDSWAKRGEAPAPRAEAPRAASKSSQKPERVRRSRADVRAEARAAEPALASGYTRLQQTLGLPEETADLLTGDLALLGFYDAAVGAHQSPALVAQWVTNEVLREVKDRSIDELPFDGVALGALVALVDDGTISSTAAGQIFEHMVEHGGDPGALVSELGLAQVSDTGALEEAVDAVIAAHPDEAARYREGKKQLIGFFVGQVMRTSGGKANPQVVRELLQERLG